MTKRVQIGLKLPEDLLELVDAKRNAMEYPPDRTEVIVKLLQRWVATEAPIEQKSVASKPANGNGTHVAAPRFVMPSLR